jgi:hypothetical protein
VITILSSSVTDKASVWGGRLDMSDPDTFFILAEMKDGSWKMYNVAAIEITRTVDGVILSNAIEAAEFHGRRNYDPNRDPNSSLFIP